MSYTTTNYTHNQFSTTTQPKITVSTPNKRPELPTSLNFDRKSLPAPFIHPALSTLIQKDNHPAPPRHSKNSTLTVPTSSTGYSPPFDINLYLLEQ